MNKRRILTSGCALVSVLVMVLAPTRLLVAMQPEDTSTSQAQSQPPAVGQPSTPAPTEGMPSGPAPKHGEPKGQPPEEGQPKENPPEGGIPNGKPPKEGNPNGEPPAGPETRRESGEILSLSPAPRVLSIQDVNRLIKAGYGLEEILQADELAANGAGAPLQLLAQHKAGTAWSELAKLGTPSGLKANDVRRLLQDPRNTKVADAVSQAAAEAGISVEQLLGLMSDQFTVGDINAAARVAKTSGRALAEVLTLKTPEVRWVDLLNQLTSGQ